MTAATPSRPRSRSAEAGFSLVETLIASVIILVILVGVLPLFERSRLNIVQGNDASNVTNATVDGLENWLSLPFNGQDVTLTAGDTLTRTDFWLLDGNRWVPDMTIFPADRSQYTRTLTLDQFNISDISDDPGTVSQLEDDEREPFDTPPGQVHLKRIRADIASARFGGPGAPLYSVTTIQSY
jgi:hypothetical protein